MGKPPLKAHQRENVEWIQRVGRGLLADEPGLGKSRSALEGFEGCDRVLIIAPSLILTTGVWADEVEQWGFDDTKYYAASYHALNVRKKTGRGTGTRPVNVLKPEWRGHWDAVIVDEAHYIKGQDTKWTWAVKQIARNCDNLLLLTGTPIPNWSHEVFTLLQTIYPEEGKRGHERLGSFWRWAERYFDVQPNPHNVRAKNLGNMLGCSPVCERRQPDDPCDHYAAFARENFGDRYMRHMRADHLDLPPLRFEDVHTPLEQSSRRAYAELKKDFATDIGDHEILAWSNGARQVLLDKMTTSPWLLTKEGEPHGGKFEQLRTDLAKRDEPTVVFAHYRDSVEAAARVAESQGLRAGFIHGGTTDKQNAALVRDFKRGRIDVLAGSLETMSEGLTLTVASEAIMLERSYKPSRNTQATYRIHRMGQDKECKITRYLTPGTVDTGKEQLLAEKNDHQMRTLSAADLLAVA